jgi:hypothetical protein
MPQRRTDGTFKPGHPRYGGRKKLTPWRKCDMTVKEVLESYKIEPVRMMLAELPNISPSQRCQVFAILMPYYYPKPQFDINIMQTVVNSNPYINLPTGELLQALQANHTNGESKSVDS